MIGKFGKIRFGLKLGRLMLVVLALGRVGAEPSPVGSKSYFTNKGLAFPSVDAKGYLYYEIGLASLQISSSFLFPIFAVGTTDPASIPGFISDDLFCPILDAKAFSTKEGVLKVFLPNGKNIYLELVREESDDKTAVYVSSDEVWRAKADKNSLAVGNRFGERVVFQNGKIQSWKFPGEVEYNYERSQNSLVIRSGAKTLVNITKLSPSAVEMAAGGEILKFTMTEVPLFFAGADGKPIISRKRTVLTKVVNKKTDATVFSAEFKVDNSLDVRFSILAEPAQYLNLSIDPLWTSGVFSALSGRVKKIDDWHIESSYDPKAKVYVVSRTSSADNRRDVFTMSARSFEVKWDLADGTCHQRKYFASKGQLWNKIRQEIVNSPLLAEQTRKFNYDQNGNLSRIILNGVANHKLDDQGRITSLNAQDGSETVISYPEGGRVLSNPIRRVQLKTRESGGKKIESVEIAGAESYSRRHSKDGSLTIDLVSQQNRNQGKN